MTDRQFLQRMISLTEKLCDVTNKDGYGSEAYHSVLDEVREMGISFNRSHRCRSWIAYFSAFSAILFVLYIIYLLFAEVSGR